MVFDPGERRRRRICELRGGVAFSQRASNPSAVGRRCGERGEIVIQEENPR